MILAGKLNDPFADLASDDLEATINAPLASKQPPASYKPMDYSEPCQRCRGTGQYGNLGPCFACKGAGKKTYKSPPAKRQAQRKHLSDRKQKNAEARQATVATAIDTFISEHAHIWSWILETKDTFNFAAAMLVAINKYGSLTDNQIAACERCIAGRQKAQAALTERVASAPEISITKIEEAFAKASAKLKKPKLHLDEFTIKHAGANSKNAGALYVTEGEEYLGKIIGGKFLAVRSCDAGRQAKVIAAAIDPQAATIRYGRLTGRCGCCNRELTDPESVERGIGPICAEGYGW